jgi:hypothetical protein
MLPVIGDAAGIAPYPRMNVIPRDFQLAPAFGTRAAHVGHSGAVQAAILGVLFEETDLDSHRLVDS